MIAIPLALSSGVWVCTLPFVFLLVGRWAGMRAAVAMALVLLAGILIICWVLCAQRANKEEADSDGRDLS